MKNFDSPRSIRSASTGGHSDSRSHSDSDSDVFVPAPSGFVSTRVVEDSFDVESWLGYESIHPLTWVPTQRVADGMQAD